MEIINEEEVLPTTQEAMQFLRVSQATIYRMIKRGDLKAHKVGKKWVFFKKDLVEFVKRNSNSPERDEDRETRRRGNDTPVTGSIEV